MNCKKITSSLLKKHLSDQNCNKIICPSNIIMNNSSLFLHGAIDNNDFLEETLSGKNTTHVTSMVLYQEYSPTLWNNVNIATTESVKDVPTDSLSCPPLEHFAITNKKPNFTSLYKDLSLLKCETDSYSEIIWILSKLKLSNCNDENHAIKCVTEVIIPNWSPFNQMLSTNVQAVTTVGHCPTIPHPPTSYDVVYTAMKRFASLCELCGKEYYILTADMAIYLMSKVIQMQATNPFPNLIMRIGTFHLQKTWIKCLGQYLDGCGIEDILVSDLELYGENTLKSVLNGLQYNRGVRLHKIIYESIKTLQIFEYIKSCSNSDLKNYLSIPQYNLLHEAIIDGDKIKVVKTFQELYECNEAKEFFKNFNNFLKTKCEGNQVFLYFTIYCEMVEVLFDSIRADRTGNFDLHLSSTDRMLPYLFSMNHPLYVRGILLYLQDMLNLLDIVKTDLNHGMTSVKRKAGEFNGVGGDLALEQTQNRSSAVSGGWTGISTNETALQTWLLLYPVKSAIHQSMLSFCNMNNDPYENDITPFSHKEWSKSHTNKDDQDVTTH